MIPLRFRSTSVLSCILLASLVATAHEGDPKAKDFKGPFIGPVWLADEQGSSLEKSTTTFRSDGVRLMAWFPVNTFNAANTSGNDVWGYVSPSGREYALMGLSAGTGFVEVTNPSSSRIVKFIAGPTSMWRNVKTYKTYAYAVSEGGGGIQVFDLSQIDNGVVTLAATVASTAATPSTHTMIINEQTGYLYRMGGGSQGVRVYNLEPNPLLPTLVSSWNPKYTHDGLVVNYTTGPYAGKEVFFACGGFNGGQTDTGVDILDMTNKASITTIGRFTYANANFCHQMWVSPDFQYGYINDELDEGNRGLYNIGRIVNLSNLAAPVAAGTYTTGVKSIDHNEYVLGNRLLCSNYTSGLRIFDRTNPSNLVEVAWFDTHPEDDNLPAASFNGLWSNYPFLPSGTVLGSDIERGLFVWKVGPEPVDISFPDGEPDMFDPRGQELVTQIVPVDGYSIAAGGVVLHTTIDGVSTTTPMTHGSGNEWTAIGPQVECGVEIEWSIEAFISDGSSVSYPNGEPSHSFAVSSYTQKSVDLAEVSTGWVVNGVGDTAYAGTWQLLDPSANAAQPADDHTPTGTKCWITGNGPPGGGAASSDLDGGSTTLTSPSYSVAGMTDPYVNYSRWYSNNTGSNGNSDSMPIQISGNGGSTWVQMELVTENKNAWVTKRFRVADFLASTNGTVKLRFIARDLGSDSVVDAAIDDLGVYEFECPNMVEGDLDGDGLVTSSDLSMILLDFGPCPGCAGDLDGSGDVDSGDVSYLLLLIG